MPVGPAAHMVPPEGCNNATRAIDPFDGDLKFQCVIDDQRADHEKAERIVYYVLGFLVAFISIALYRVDGDLLHCEPYYLKEEIHKSKKMAAKNRFDP